MKHIQQLQQLQPLLCKVGDVDIKNCTTYEFESEKNLEEYFEQFKLFYNNVKIR